MCQCHYLYGLFTYARTHVYLHTHAYVLYTMYNTSSDFSTLHGVCMIYRIHFIYIHARTPIYPYDFGVPAYICFFSTRARGEVALDFHSNDLWKGLKSNFHSQPKPNGNT